MNRNLDVVGIDTPPESAGAAREAAQPARATRARLMPAHAIAGPATDWRR